MKTEEEVKQMHEKVKHLMKTEEEVKLIYEQVKHLIESDVPIDQSTVAYAHEFTEDEQSLLQSVFPDKIPDGAGAAFFDYLSPEIGTYHWLAENPITKGSNEDARARLDQLRQLASQLLERIDDIPIELHEWLNLAITYVENLKRCNQGKDQLPYAVAINNPYSVASARWMRTFIDHINDFDSALSHIEEKLEGNVGGNPEDLAMTYLSLQTGITYKKCFGVMPTMTEGGSFDQILAALAQIVGRGDDWTRINVNHFAKKSVNEIKRMDKDGVIY